MGLFSKKKKVDLDVTFKDLYKSINQTMMQAQNELDDKVKESLYALVVEKYKDLIDLIDQGAHFDREHFVSLQQSALKDYQRLKDLNEDLYEH